MVVRTHVKDQAFRVRMRKVFDQGKPIGTCLSSHGTATLTPSRISFTRTKMSHSCYNTMSATRRLKSKGSQSRGQRQGCDCQGRASWRLEEEVYNQLPKGKSLTNDEIAKALILTSLRSGKYMPNDYLIKSMVTRIQFRLLDGDVNAEDHFADGIVWRIYHKYD